MMLAYRLLRLVENHSETLATGLLENTKNSHLLAAYRKVMPFPVSGRTISIVRENQVAAAPLCCGDSNEVTNGRPSAR
jgi:hypothetical protein